MISLMLQSQFPTQAPAFKLLCLLIIVGAATIPLLYWTASMTLLP